MKNTPFSYFYTETFSIFKLDINILSKEIDRHPSRLRHWKNNTAPPKQLIHKISDVLLKLILEQNDQFAMNKFMHIIKHQTKHLTDLPYDVKEELLAIDDFEKFFKFAILRFYEWNSEFEIQEYKELLNDTTLDYRTSVELAESYISKGLLDEARNEYEQIIKGNIHIDNTDVLFDVYSNLGALYQNKAMLTGKLSYFEESIFHFEKSLTYVDSNTKPYEYSLINKYMGTNYTELSEMYFSKKYHSLALKHYNIALVNFESLGLREDKAKIINNIGIVYMFLAKYENPRLNFLKSQSHYETALSLNEGDFSQIFLSLIYLNYGSVVGFLGQLTGSLKDYDKAIDRLNQALNVFSYEESPINYGNIHLNLGFINILKGQYEGDSSFLYLAETHFKKCAFVFKDTSNLKRYLQVRLNMTFMYLVLYELTKAKEYLLKATNIYEDCKTYQIDPHLNEIDLLNKFVSIELLYFTALHEQSSTKLSSTIDLAKSLLENSDFAMQPINKNKLYHLLTKAYIQLYKMQKTADALHMGIFSCDHIINSTSIVEMPLIVTSFMFLKGELLYHLYESTQNYEYKKESHSILSFAKELLNAEHYPMLQTKINGLLNMS